MPHRRIQRVGQIPVPRRNNVELPPRPQRDARWEQRPTDGRGSYRPQKAMEKDKLAILTGIYTGDSERNMIFYTRNITAFGNRLNEALATFEQLPITIYTENDSEWNEYAEMQELNPGDDENDEEL